MAECKVVTPRQFGRYRRDWSELHRAVNALEPGSEWLRIELPSPELADLARRAVITHASRRDDFRITTHLDDCELWIKRL